MALKYKKIIKVIALTKEGNHFVNLNRYYIETEVLIGLQRHNNFFETL